MASGQEVEVDWAQRESSGAALNLNHPLGPKTPRLGAEL